MLKVGVIGCGAIAKMHIPAIKECPNAELVGIADLNQKFLDETAERYGITNKYSDAFELLAKEKPNVVHILTPPQNHHMLTKAALEAGAHVFVEKPLTMNADEARDLIAIAKEKNLQICVGHSHLFDGIMRQARAMVEQGAIGTLCGIESYYGFDMDPKYFSAKGSTHWGHRLPGGLLMNRIDHPLSVVLPFMGEIKSIQAMAVDVKDAIPLNIPGELRMMFSDGKAIAQMTVSLAVSPRSHSLTLFGTKGIILLDFVNKRIVKSAHIAGLPKSISRLILNMKEGWSMIGATLGNVFKVLTGKFHPVEGMPVLIKQFYKALETGDPCPVPQEQGLEAMRIMDEAWRQIGCKPAAGPVNMDELPKPERKTSSRVLVTGATGFVGLNLIKSLCDEGKHDVRVLVRNPIKAYAVLRDLPVEIYFGDLTDPEKINEAMEGVDIVYHLGAAMGGAWEDYDEITVKGTKRIIDAVLANKVKKLVCVSSIAVYGIPGDCKNRVSEETPYATADMTDYMRSKIEAERVILDAVKKDGLNATILRPGAIYGPGVKGVSRIGYKAGKLFVIIGFNDIDLPLTYVGSVVKALKLAGEAENGAGKIYNVVDDERVSQTGYIQRLSKYGGSRFNYVFFPYTLAAGMGVMARGGGRFNGKVKKIANLLSPFHLRTCSSNLVYDNSKIKKDLGWQPEPGLEEHFERMCKS